MDVNGFADRLPHGNRNIQLIDDSRGVTFLEKVEEDFVSPRLTDYEDSDTGAGLVLIVAPAAAGKSTCARAIAARSGALFIDLARRRVGDASFLGMLAESLGMDGALQFIATLKSNQVALVLDSLDETSLVSGELNFAAFLQGICRTLRQSNGCGNVVLLSRMDTADWVVNTFELEGLPLRRMTIEYFSKEEARAYIDLKLDRLYAEKGLKGLPHRINELPYAKAQGAIMERIANGLEAKTDDYWSEENVRRFLGYSPVLDAIAASLCVSNHHQLAERTLAEEVPSEGSLPEWRILKQLTEDLLVREQQKFTDGWVSSGRQSTGSGFDKRQAYTPFEQCIRILSLVELGTSAVELPASLPLELREDYRDRVAQQLREHPFITTRKEYVSGIFRDYMYALVLCAPEVAGEVGKCVVQKLRSANILPSPSLAPFVVELIRASAPHGTLPADRCDLLISSLSSRRDGELTYEYHIDADERTGELEVQRITQDVRRESVALVPLAVEGLELRLPARCQNLVADYAGDVEVVAPGQVVKFGPALSIRSHSLSLEASSLFVECGEEQPVSIESQLILSEYSLEVRKFGDGEFFVVGKNIEGSLLLHQASSSREEEDIDRYFYALRRLLLHFRSTVHMGAGRKLSASKDRLNRFVIRSDPIAGALMEYFEKVGIVRKEGLSFILDVGQLTDQGINHADVKNFRVTPQIAEFLSKQMQETI